jgi:hypothetical protein
MVTHRSAEDDILATHPSQRSAAVTRIDLDLILAALNQYQQRATYSAVAALVGQPPRILMRSRPRQPEASWVVSKTTGRPTGYTDADIHPSLTSNATVIQTQDELASWLRDRGVEV